MLSIVPSGLHNSLKNNLKISATEWIYGNAPQMIEGMLLSKDLFPDTRLFRLQLLITTPLSSHPKGPLHMLTCFYKSTQSKKKS